jgi:UDP-glucose 4-epimerase
MKRCLVVGGSGFIGRNLIVTLAARGYNVSGLSRSNTLDNFERPFKWHWGDFSNRQFIYNALAGVDIVFHLASTSVIDTAQADIFGDIDNNVKASISLMDACAEQKIQRLIFLSSGGTVYGPDVPMPATESSPTNPISAYGVAKLSIEKYLYMYAHAHGLKSTVVRLSNPYGPNHNREKTQGAIPIFLRRLLKGQEIAIWGNGKITRDYIHVNDVSEALIAIFDEDNPFSIYNIGSGVGHSLVDIVDIISEVCQLRPVVNFLPSRKFDVLSSILDIGRAREMLGWSPKIRLREGIEMTYRDLTAEANLL